MEDINLLNDEEVVIGTEHIHHDTTWQNGQKILLEFSTDNTEFTKMEWIAEYYIHD